jgi:Protein of unknown function (DUF3592).
MKYSRLLFPCVLLALVSLGFFLTYSLGAVNMALVYRSAQVAEGSWVRVDANLQSIEPKVRARWSFTTYYSIDYAYNWGGRKYVGGNYSLSRRNPSRGELQSYLKMESLYAKNQVVPVYMNKDDPSMSVLVLESLSDLKSKLFLYVIISGVSLVVLILSMWGVAVGMKNIE